jgi:hypothetical protein
MLKFIKQPIKMALKNINLRIVRDCGPCTFAEIDQEFNKLYDHAQKMTQMSQTDNTLRRLRHHTLMQVFKNVLPDINKGNIAECGCFRGLSAYQLAYYAQRNNFKNRFIIFDSFEGLSEFQNEDINGNANVDKEWLKKALSCPEDIVQENLKEFRFIEYKKGWIPNRFNDASELKFVFVHIDVDLYQPIKESLEFFYPRTISGGVIALDDYGCLTFPGARQAVDGFMKNKRDFFIYLPSGEAFIIKG